MSTRCSSSPGRSASSTRRPPRASRRSRISARSAGSSSTRPRTRAEFRADRLAQFRAVVFLNTSGDVLTDAQQAAFEDYYRDGGGFVGIHSAIDTERDWSFLADVLGTRSTGALGRRAGDGQGRRPRARASKSLPEYWQRTDQWYDFAANVRGRSHVLATVDETTYTGGDDGFDHPVAWCKDFRGGRSFYTAGGHTAAAYGEPAFRRHLAGGIEWAAGEADPVYSDCGATVLANYEQTKISAPPNLNEPIGFDQLPDGRILQTARGGQLRLHDPVANSSAVIATLPVYTNSEDGLYGPAVDNDFATNRWVYLFYAPLSMDAPYPPSTPAGAAPLTPQADPSAWDAWKGYFQLSRFKFVDGENPTLDLASEQKILKVDNNRGACCHVAGDIDFDRHNNLWLVTGDDTPAGGGNSGGFSPFNDDAHQRDADRAHRGRERRHVHADLRGPDHRAARLQRDRRAGAGGARGARRRRSPATSVASGGPVSTANVSVNFRGALSERNVAQLTADGSGLTGTTPASRPRPPPRAGSTTRRGSTRGAARSTPTTCAASCCASTSPPTAPTRCRPATCSRSPRTRTARPARRSTRWASATRSGSRSTRTTSPT